MRIVIDMQGALTQSRFRGIGRYTMGLAKGIARNRKDHDIHLALNGMLPEGIELIRAEFADILPHENIHVWHSICPVAHATPDSASNREIASAIYSQFIASLEPDALLICSMMEGWKEDFCCDFTLGDSNLLVAGVAYDFMPYKQPQKHLAVINTPWYFGQFKKLSNMDLLLSISDYTNEEAQTYIPDVQCVSISSACNDVFRHLALSSVEEDGIRERLGLSRQFILYAGGLDERKNVQALFLAYSLFPQSLRNDYQLVIPCGGSLHLREALRQKAQEYGLKESELLLLGRVSDKDLCALYNLCELFVFPSLEEGFGLPVLEAMRCGAAVICSNTTSLPEVIGLPEAMFDPQEPQSIAAKMIQALMDKGFRQQLLENGASRQALFSWDISARRALKALEEASRKKGKVLWVPMTDEQRLHAVCGSISGISQHPENITAIADSLARTFPISKKKQLLVDIGNLVIFDARTGIQRVTRSIAAQLLASPPTGYEVRLVYAQLNSPGYLYAHDYLLHSFGIDDGLDADIPIDWSNDDIFIGLDLQAHIVPNQLPSLRRMHRDGVRIFFVVHDILPIQFPQYCTENMTMLFPSWLRAIGEFDGLLCVSHTTLEAVQNWMLKNGPERLRPLEFHWFHNGSDIEGSQPTSGMPTEASAVLESLSSAPSILMVSTIEPRKQQKQSLDAVELLWAKGVDVNLVLVGKSGWKMEDFEKRLKIHPELGRRLFWLQGISDEYLEKVYNASAAVLMASEGEGFGLAIVEGARHGKPLILRDIPVFREIAGDNAFYFKGLQSKELAMALENWLKLYKAGTVPVSAGIRCLTWKESAAMLLTRLPLTLNAD